MPDGTHDFRSEHVTTETFRMTWADLAITTLAGIIPAPIRKPEIILPQWTNSWPRPHRLLVERTEMSSLIP